MQFVDKCAFLLANAVLGIPTGVAFAARWSESSTGLAARRSPCIDAGG